MKVHEADCLVIIRGLESGGGGGLSMKCLVFKDQALNPPRTFIPHGPKKPSNSESKLICHWGLGFRV